MNFLNKYSDKTLRIFLIIITVYCLILSGIPLFKATITERLTVDDCRKEHIKNDKNENILVISQMLPGGVSEEAGLKKGDRILSVNGTEIHEFMDLVYTLNKTASGEEAVYTILRNGEE